MLAVKLYETMPSDDENVIKGISGKIPAVVIDTDIAPAPDNSYILMTQDEFNAYNASLEAEYQAWNLINN